MGCPIVVDVVDAQEGKIVKPTARALASIGKQALLSEFGPVPLADLSAFLWVFMPPAELIGTKSISVFVVVSEIGSVPASSLAPFLLFRV